MGILGWVANTITVVWTIFATVIYCLPPDIPVTAGNMSKFAIFAYMAAHCMY